MKKIIITGGDGFVGHSLLNFLQGFDYSLSASFHSMHSNKANILMPEINWFRLDLGDDDTTVDKKIFRDVDTVIHLAAQVHARKNDRYTLQAYRTINTGGTIRVAEAAADQGVRRFIFLSTIKVNGEKTGYAGGEKLHRFSETDVPSPADPYAMSKYEAEKGLIGIHEKTGMEYVILRPPIIYGPGVKANFLRLIKWVDAGIPLPLGAIKNLRSLLYIENLDQVIHLCIEQQKAANQLFLVGDADISTPELIKKIAHHLGKPVLLFRCPVLLLKWSALLAGQKNSFERLHDSLLLDNTRLKSMLDWSPCHDLDHGLRTTVEWFRQYKNGVR